MSLAPEAGSPESYEAGSCCTPCATSQSVSAPPSACRGSGGVFLVGAGLFVFFDAKSQIDDSPLEAKLFTVKR